MTEVSFYHLQRTPLERALPKLMEKALSSGARVVVRTGSNERAEFLSEVLWVYENASFLPHGTDRDGNDSMQPIWITPGEDVPNEATIVALTDGVRDPDLDRFQRCLDIFDGQLPEAVAMARQRWLQYKSEGHSLAYWQQTKRGGWTRKG